MPHGYYLYCRLIKGIDLLNRDASIFSSANKSDPYVQLSIGNPSEKDLPVETETQVIDDDLNPQWEETLKVFVTDDQYNEQHCVLRIWDKEPVGKSAMGQVSIKLKDIPMAGEGGKVAGVPNPEIGKEWPPLPVVINPKVPTLPMSSKKCAKGELVVAAKLVPFGTPARATPADGATPAFGEGTPGGVPPPPPGAPSSSLNSSQLESLAKILSISAQLKAQGIVVRPPKIAVVGGQSAGKSTIFNVILREVGSAAQFPTGDGTCTKVPTILSLKQSAAGEKAKVTIDAPGNPPFHKELSYGQPTDVHIMQAQRTILQSQGLDPDTLVFSEVSVMVTVSSPDMAQQVVLVDLPGMISMSLPQAQEVKNLITAQITGRNTLIVAAGKTDNDDDTDDGLQLARSPSIDPDGSRTLRAHTFWNIARPFHKDRVCKQIAAAPADKKGHVLALRMDASNQLVPDTVEGVPPTNYGTTSFVSRLAGMLGPLVRSTKDELYNQFNSHKMKIDDRLKTVGTETPSSYSLVAQQLRPVRALLADKLKELEKFTDIVLKLKANILTADGSQIKEEEIQWWRPEASELPMFQGYDATKATVDLTLRKWIPFTEVMLAEFYELCIKEMITEDALGQLPDLTAEAKRIIKEKWEKLAKREIELMKKKLIPDENKYIRHDRPDGTFGAGELSALEQLFNAPKANMALNALSGRELEALLEPNKPIDVLNGYKELENGETILARIKTESDKYHPSSPFDLDRAWDENDGTFDEKEVPGMAKMIAIVRDRIKTAAMKWVGDCQAEGNDRMVGAVESYMTTVQSCVEDVIREFKALVADISEQPGIQGALASDPYEEERKKLLDTLALIKEAMDEIQKL